MQCHWYSQVVLGNLIDVWFYRRFAILSPGWFASWLICFLAFQEKNHNSFIWCCWSSCIWSLLLCVHIYRMIVVGSWRNLCNAALWLFRLLSSGCNDNVTRSYLVKQAHQLVLQYWLLRSSKVNDFHVIWKAICDFLLVINSNLGPIFYLLATIVHTVLQGRSRLMIFVLFEKVYAISY